MRRIAFLLLLFPFALSAQEESCIVLGVQELSQLYQDLLDAHAELQEQFALLRGVQETTDNGDGTITFTFTDGTSFTTGDLTGPAGVGVDSVVDNGDGTITITLTDGSSTVTTLVIYGCTDSNFTEYNPEAMVDNGTCSTLIVNGCTNPAYTEYSASANTDDGSCTTLVVNGCTDANYTEYDASANTDDGSCASYACSSIEFDGYTYSLVEIGDQCWFSENLRITTYADGTPIPEVTDDATWLGLSSGARCDYNNDASNVATYGRLYNWHAVDDTRGLCPAGWHVPTDGEWTELEAYITSEGFAGTEGTALKSTAGWSNNGNGTDDFGFSALPGGNRYQVWGISFFSNAGVIGYWWSSSVAGNYVWGRNLDSDSPAIGRNDDYPRDGFSVRCLRDAE